jgi:ATP-dependent RNA helicase SUPV3L1/SUV3
MAIADSGFVARQVLPDKQAQRRERLDEIDQAVTVRIPNRRSEPERVVAHLGPTNSGKTYSALEALAKVGRGTYAAPLRMLAQEAHTRLSARLGPEAVGLLTGEERINARAAIICCTPEMAPLRGHVLVLDEVHWAEDDDRGYAWSRLLASAEYRQLHLLGSPDAAPLIAAAFPDCQWVMHQRLAPLSWIGAVRYQQIESGTVVIAFSRAAVLYLADLLAEHYGAERVVALYGALPLDVRRAQIARVLSGSADIVVATDVLGHGVNLPARTVLFAETDKFDGDQRRPLAPWETAQIAGRAGRYGLTADGHVGMLVGCGHFHPAGSIVRAGLTPSLLLGRQVAFRRVERGRLRPELADLGVTDITQLRPALKAWERQAQLALADHHWLTIESTAQARTRLTIVQRWLDHWSVPEAWRLIQSPLDPHHDLDKTVLAATARERQLPGSLAMLLPERLGHTMIEAEQLARIAQGVRWAGQTFAWPEIAAQAADLEAAAGQRVLACLNDRHDQRPGRCQVCGRDCQPWFAVCQRCHLSRS